MRVSQILIRFNIVELKALVEYCAIVNGFSEEFTPPSENQRAVYVIKELLSELGGQSRALFELLRRIPSSDLCTFFVNNDKPATCSTYIDEHDFLSFLKSEAFEEYVMNNSSTICFNSFLEELSKSKFENIIRTLFTNRDIDTLIDHLEGELNKAITRIVYEGATVLSLYSTVPQLRQGLVNRCQASKHIATMTQDGMYYHMFSEYETYTKQMSFDPSRNQTVVVTKYLGAVMAYFLSTWYRTLVHKYTTALTVIGTSKEDGHLIFASDKVKAKAPVEKSPVNIYNLFQEVRALDSKLFCKKHAQANDIRIPYYSIVDFVIETLSRDTVTAANRNLQRCTQTAGLSLKPVATFRGDLILKSTSKNNPQIITRMNNAMELISLIYTHMDKLNVSTFSNICNSIIHIVNMKCSYKASDIPVIKEASFVYRDEATDEDISLYPDETYELIGSIVELLGKLFITEQAAQTYGTSLAYLWYAFLKEDPGGLFNGLLAHQTIPEYLEYVLALQCKDDLADDGYNASPLNFCTNANNIKTFATLKTIPYSQATASYTALNSLSHAGILHSRAISTSTFVNGMFKSLYSIDTTNVLPDYNHFKKWYCDELLLVPIVPEVQFGGGLSIDRPQGYAFSSSNIGIIEYCNHAIRELCSTYGEHYFRNILDKWEDIRVFGRQAVPEDIYYTLQPLAGTDSEISIKLVNHFLNYAIDMSEFSFQNFYELVNTQIDSLSMDTILTALNLNIDDLTMETKASLFMYVILFGFYALLWESLDMATVNTGLNNINGVSPFCDINLITDLGFAIIKLHAMLNNKYNQHISNFSSELQLLTDRPAIADNKTYTVTHAHICQRIAIKYNTFCQDFLVPVKRSCDNVFSASANWSSLDILTSNLDKLGLGSCILMNDIYYDDETYCDLLTNVLYGSIQSFLSYNKINSTITSLCSINKHTSEYNIFVRQYLHLDSYKMIPIAYRRKEIVFQEKADYLRKAFSETGYAAALLQNSHTDTAIMQRFLNRRASYLVDELKYCRLPDSISTSSSYITVWDESEDIEYYLSQDGVWVGIDFQNKKLTFKSYPEGLELENEGY